VLLITAVAGVTAAVLPATSGSATPSKSIASVQREVDALNSQADIADEAYSQAKIKLSAASRRTAAAEARVAAAQKAILAQRKALAAVAVGAYRSGTQSLMLSLVTTSNPQNFLDRASSLTMISTHQADSLRALRIAQLRVDQAQAVARQALAAQHKVAKELHAKRDAIQAVLSKQQALLSSLKAAERRRLAALERARQAAIDAAAQQASRSLPRPTYTGPASGRAAVAVKFAYNQLGKPYQWGAAGPSSYDCSGLTMRAWGAAGVSLSHSSAAQYNEGNHVSRADIRPGDLVFFGSPIHHVGIYIGHGDMINAPQTGDVVKIEASFRSDYVGATRP
jgi:cell wall-associated NlpC family hydrolase